MGPAVAAKLGEVLADADSPLGQGLKYSGLYIGLYIGDIDDIDEGEASIRETCDASRSESCCMIKTVSVGAPHHTASNCITLWPFTVQVVPLLKSNPFLNLSDRIAG